MKIERKCYSKQQYEWIQAYEKKCDEDQRNQSGEEIPLLWGVTMGVELPGKNSVGGAPSTIT